MTEENKEKTTEPKAEQESTGPEPITWGSSKQILNQLGLVLVIALCWVFVFGTVALPQEGDDIVPVRPGEELTWTDHIYPIVQRNCILCHGSSGGLNLTAYENALEGGVHGPAIVPGDASSSLLYQILLGPVNDIPRMPLGQDPLPQATIDIIGQWINQLPAGE